MISRFVPTLVGLALLVVGGVLIVGKVTEDPKYVVYAEFDDAGGILKNYNVKIGAVAAGTIEDIQLDEDDDAVIKMELDEGAYPIGQGATAKVRPVNLLGEKYIDLDPGDLSKPVEDGTLITKDKTDIPVELDDAINILEPDTRGALRILINEAGLALAGRGADFNKTLDELPRALDSAERLVSDIDEENEELERAIVTGDRVINSVNAGREDFAELVDSAADALSTVADRRARLGETVRGAPAAIDELRTTLTRLQGASADLTPAARDLRTAAPSLANTLEKAPAFTKDAKDTLATATRVAPMLTKLGRRTTPSLRELRPTANRLAQFTTDFQPLFDTLDKERGLIDFLGFMDGWAGVTDGKDGLGNHFRLRATVDDALVDGIGNFLPQGTTRSTRKKAAPAKKAPAPAPAAPSAPSAPPAESPKLKLPELPTKPLTDGLNRGLKDLGETVGGAVDGLTGALQRELDGRKQGPSDTTKLFNYLLGP